MARSRRESSILVEPSDMQMSIDFHTNELRTNNTPMGLKVTPALLTRDSNFSSTSCTLVKVTHVS